MTMQPFARLAALAAVCLLPLSACDREDQAEVDERMDEISEDVDEALEEAEPVVEEGLRDAGDAVGTGLEAAGEVMQQGGEGLQEEARDTSATTLPDTLSDTTMVLQ